MRARKKYFSISEVSKLTGLSPVKLRYIEKSNHLFKVLKIRDRRYYTNENLRYITEVYQIRTKNIQQGLDRKNNNMIEKIDNILNRFKEFI